MHLFHKQKLREGTIFCGVMMVSCIQRGKLFTNFTSIYGIMKDKAFRSLTFLDSDFSVSLDIYVFPSSNSPQPPPRRENPQEIKFTNLQYPFNY